MKLNLPTFHPLNNRDPFGTVYEPELRGVLVSACEASLAAYRDKPGWWDYAAQAGFKDADVIHVVDPENLIDVQVCWAAGEVLLLAFRGTPKDSLAAWIQNLDPRRRDVLGGSVHAGFHNEFLAIERQMCEVIRMYSDRKLVLTGHSKGGALARVTAYVRRKLNLPLGGVYTFGEPRSLGWGSSQWLDDKLWCTPNLRCIHSNDPVPLLPGLTVLNRWRYRHGGHRTLLTEEGQLIRNASKWDVVKEWVRGFEFDAMEDHYGESYLADLVVGETAVKHAA